MATEDNSGIGGRKTRIDGDSSTKSTIEKGKSKRFEANEKKKKDK